VLSAAHTSCCSKGGFSGDAGSGVAPFNASKSVESRQGVGQEEVRAAANRYGVLPMSPSTAPLCLRNFSWQDWSCWTTCPRERQAARRTCRSSLELRSADRFLIAVTRALETTSERESKSKRDLSPLALAAACCMRRWPAQAEPMTRADNTLILAEAERSRRVTASKPPSDRKATWQGTRVADAFNLSN